MTLRETNSRQPRAIERVRVPWFFRSAPNAMHHVEVISQLEGQKVEHLEELMAIAAAVDNHEPIGEHKFLRLQHGDDKAIGFMAYEDGALVGYAHTLTYRTGEDLRVSCEMVVHPDYRRSGVGRTLLSYVLRHAEAEAAGRLDLWAYNDSPGSRGLTTEFGFEDTRRLLHMHRHPGPPPIVASPERTRIRVFQPGADEELWLAMNNSIFAGHPENGNWTMDDLLARMAQPWFRADDLLILEANGQAAGFCWLKVEERGDEGYVGEVYVIGTLPEYHGRGLGRYLLGEGLRHLSERGVAAVAVYVDQSNERAVALYWAFEFHHHHVDVLYSLPLPAPSLQRDAATAAG